jgi:hypothetical protein
MEFTLSRPEHEPQLRALLRDSPMPGWVRLTYERETGGCRLKWRAWETDGWTTLDGKPVGEPLELSEKEEMLTIGPVRSSVKAAGASPAEGR